MKTYNIPENTKKLYDAEDGKGIFYITKKLIFFINKWEIEEEKIYLKVKDV